jgi:hypothetical protein
MHRLGIQKLFISVFCRASPIGRSAGGANPSSALNEQRNTYTHGHARTHTHEPTKQIIQSVLLFPNSFRAHTEDKLFHQKLFVMILFDLSDLSGRVHETRQKQRKARPGHHFHVSFFSSPFSAKFDPFLSRGQQYLNPLKFSIEFDKFPPRHANSCRHFASFFF